MEISKFLWSLEEYKQLRKKSDGQTESPERRTESIPPQSWNHFHLWAGNDSLRLLRDSIHNQASSDFRQTKMRGLEKLQDPLGNGSANKKKKYVTEVAWMKQERDTKFTGIRNIKMECPLKYFLKDYFKFPNFFVQIINIFFENT